jgi:MoaA/NifB/PqqE/SkfB family radical SAM enzyme
VAGAAASCLYHEFIDGPDRWYPVLSVFYLTNRCRFRCPYCSDGAGKPYHELDDRILPAPAAVSLLGAIRRHCEHVVITGGEPLEHPEVDAVLEGTRGVGFKSVVFTTNGHELDQHLDTIAGTVTNLVVSLDTLDGREGDAQYGAGAGVHARVLSNIERAAELPGRRFEMTISSVVTPGGIPDLHAVYAWAKERDFTFAACPQLVGVKAQGDLVGNPRYREFYDFLIAEKRRGGKVFGTVRYLEYMRDLRKFRCRPFTMLVVSPLGQVFYPCLEQGHHAGNLLGKADLHALRREARKVFGPQPDCDNRCHSACALGFGVGLAYPSSLASEAWLQVRAAMRRGSLRLRGVRPYTGRGIG